MDNTEGGDVEVTVPVGDGYRVEADASSKNLDIQLDPEASRKITALTAMGTSMAMVWNNIRPMIVWGFVVLLLFALSVATGFLGLVIIFPWLVHATWHAYRAMR